ncbi:hypothetical protein RRG08_061057 [Elysia crispata]|uniref:Uncharacterized protein n=1 Tax=Elysia crispata TaxID=231223 RepID=A0AAE1AUR9_9GAST|nr:hypothetical protein RRG08_061057 [Elysia crispata]
MTKSIAPGQSGQADRLVCDADETRQVKVMILIYRHAWVEKRLGDWMIRELRGKTGRRADDRSEKWLFDKLIDTILMALVTEVLVPSSIDAS